MNAKAELAELVDDHLGRNATMAKAALGSVIAGLAKFLTAYADAQARRGNWGTMLDNLRRGMNDIEPVLPLLKSQGGPGVATIVELAESELRFAAEMQEEIVRLSAGESTNV
jgi:hypothetical protein